jgi:hypothetical protein
MPYPIMNIYGGESTQGFSTSFIASTVQYQGDTSSYIVDCLGTLQDTDELSGSAHERPGCFAERLL